MSAGYGPVDRNAGRQTPEGSSQSRLRYDDRIDTETDISTIEAVGILGRSLKLLAAVKGLFAAKALLSISLVLPGLIMPWLAKIVIDNAVMQEPFGQTDVRYPPFMGPLIAYLDGMAPMEIMLTLTVMYVILLFVIGTRAGETNVFLSGGDVLTGADVTAQPDNRISGGWSAAGGIWGLLEFRVDVRMTQRIANALRTRLFERLSRLPMTTLDDQRIGDSVYRVLYDSAMVPSLCYELTLWPFFALTGALINMYLLQYSYGTVSPEVVWAAWAMLPITFLITFPASGLLRRVNQTKRSAGSATTNAMEETMGNITAVQSLGGMRREKERFDKRSRESYKRERIATLVGIAMTVLGGIAAVIGAVYVAFIVTDRIIDGGMTPGDFGVLFGIYFGLVGNAVGIGAFWISLQDKVAAIRRVFFFIDYESDDDQKGGIELPPICRGVTFEDVSFTYPDGRNALKDVSIEMRVGKLVAIVGPTGSGKTSLAYLIPSFLMPTSGRVLIDGKDISKVDLDSLRDQVAYVFQEHILLSESIRENLLMANPSATDADMRSALERSGCMDFIGELPDGIDTVLGRSGDTLSVGQQQRLSIARGLIRNANVLILDEPTAALDPTAEAALVGGLQEAVKGRLVVIIAHRLSTIRSADCIIFLEDGEVKDVGTHEELMSIAESPYRLFVELQQA